MSQIADSPEQKALNLYTKISSRLDFWAHHYQEKNIDPLLAKQLMLEKVNDELYTKEFKSFDEKIETVPHEISVALFSYLTQFDKDEWEAYSNDKSFYLLIPKKYLKELEKKNQSHPTQKNLTQKELLLGLKVDHLTKIEDLENPAQCYFDAQKNANSLPSCMNDFFVTNSEWHNKSMPYFWNIILTGHGGHHYHETTTNKVISTVTTVIADLSPDEFHTLLQYCDHSLTMNCFYYATCFGAGNHIKMIFDDQGNPSYHYTIICGSIADGYVHCLWKHFPFPNAEKTPLSATDITCGKDGKWHLSQNHKYSWTQFFEGVSHNSFKNPNLDWLIDTLPSITYTTVCDTPLVRLPHATSFIPALPQALSIINTTLIALKQEENAEHIRICHDIVLVDAASIPLPVIIKNPSRIVSIQAGSSSHYFTKIEFKNGKKWLETFNPIEGNYYFDKYFLIDELIIPNDKNSALSKKLGLESEKIVATNVLVRAQQDNLIRIFARIENNCYMITINRTDYLKGTAQLKGFTKMSPASVKMYLDQYTKLKESILSEKTA